ncbi:hypothetical protein BMS3Abin05_02063 [bacterium BMS3Abin05]|nr:hypothetical protein BMS3Abin05_02063 [bacterium BMS3Abin05]
MKKHFLGLIVFGLLLAGTSEGGAQTRLGGYLKFYSAANTVSPFKISKIGTRLQFNISKTFGTRGELFSSFDFDADDARFFTGGFKTRGSELEIYPVEAYVNLYFPFVDLRLGKQFIFWGKTDWINPTDNINPWDYKNISSEIEDYRLPVTAVKTSWYLGPVTLEADWIPVFIPDRIPLQTGLLQKGNPARHIPVVFMNSPAYPTPTLGHSQAAFRLMHSIEGIDYSLSYYAGYDHKFNVISKFTSPDSLSLTPAYKPVRIIGGALERVFGRWNLKGEAAYFRTADPNGTHPEITNPHVQYVLGSDLSVSDHLLLNLQWIQNIRTKFNRALEEKAAAQNPLEQEIPRRVTSSVSGVIRWSPMDYVTSQFVGVLNLRDKDSFLLGFVHYELADAIQLTIGGLFFGGPQNSPFGKMTGEDKVFLELKFSY